MIRRAYEAHCDLCNHWEVVYVSTKAQAQKRLRARGWKVCATGKLECMSCVTRRECAEGTT